MFHPRYGNGFSLLLIALPCGAAVGFFWLACALHNRGHSDAAWATTFFSLTLWVLFDIGLILLMLPSRA